MSDMSRPRAVDPGGHPSGSTGASEAPTDETTAALTRLLQLSARGDEGAFAQFYDATSARTFGLAVRVIRDRALAEEVLQEVYLEVWRTAARFDPDRGSALSWLLTMVHRRAVDRVRSVEASSRREQTYHQTSPGTAHDSTAEEATVSLEAERVRQAVSDLTPTQREALELAYFGGYTHTEVASMLDLPLGTAKTRIRDGLIRLRDRLGVGA